MPELETETEEEEDRVEEQSPKGKASIAPGGKAPIQEKYQYTWSSTGTDMATDDEGSNDESDWTALEEGTSGETTEEEEKSDDHNSNDIK